MAVRLRRYGRIWTDHRVNSHGEPPPFDDSEYRGINASNTGHRSRSQSFLDRSVSRLGTSLFGAEASGQVSTRFDCDCVLIRYVLKDI
jgi:hypothetical protein